MKNAQLNDEENEAESKSQERLDLSGIRLENRDTATGRKN